MREYRFRAWGLGAGGLGAQCFGVQCVYRVWGLGSKYPIIVEFLGKHTIIRYLDL